MTLKHNWYRIGRIEERKLPDGKIFLHQSAGPALTKEQAHDLGYEDGWMASNKTTDHYLLGFDTLEEAQSFNPETDM